MIFRFHVLSISWYHFLLFLSFCLYDIFLVPYFYAQHIELHHLYELCFINKIWLIQGSVLVQDSQLSLRSQGKAKLWNLSPCCSIWHVCYMSLEQWSSLLLLDSWRVCWFFTLWVSVCVCVCVCACVWESAWVCVCLWERESVCVCVCVCVRERERERLSDCVWERVCVW